MLQLFFAQSFDNVLYKFPFIFSLEPRLYMRVCPSVPPLVCQSVHPFATSFFGGQKQRWQTIYAVYWALLFFTLAFFKYSGFNVYI